MGFAWIQDVSVGATVDAADANEVKTNLDTIYTALSITRIGCGAGAGWVELPVVAGGIIQSVDFQELRDVTDYAYDNMCPAHNVADDSGVDAADESGVNSNDHGTYNSGYDSAEDVDDHGTYHSGYDSGVNNDDHGDYYSSAHCSGVDSSYHP